MISRRYATSSPSSSSSSPTPSAATPASPTTLNADSLDVVELSMTIEEMFDLGEISEDDLKKISTIGDLVDYVEKASAN